MKKRKFTLVNQYGQSFVIKANSPEVALIKAGRMGDIGWHIVDELSDTQYCYITTKRALSKENNELTNELFHYFKARMTDRYLDAYMHADCIENLIGIREHEDIVKYIIDYY